MLATEVPYTLYFDKAGKPLDGGSIYFGVANQNPETNPQTVYWDAAGTQPVAQPVSTIAGYPVRNGTIAQIYSPTDYSVTVRDKSGQLVRYEASSANFSAASQTAALASNLLSSAGSTFVSFLQSGISAITMAVQTLLRERISVTQFGATDDNTLCQAAVQAAINEANARGGGIVWFPRKTSGKYNIGSGLTTYGNVVLMGDSGRYNGNSTRGVSLVLSGNNVNGIYCQYGLDLQLRNLVVDCSAVTGWNNNGIYGNGLWKSTLEHVTVLGTTQTFTASITSNVLTVTTIGANRLAVGQLISGQGVTPGTTISSLGTGTGGVGTYNLTATPNVSSQSFTAFLGKAIRIDTASPSGNQGAQHIRLVQCECADGIIKIGGTSGSDAVTSTVIDTCRGYMYDFSFAQVTLINANAEQWPDGSYGYSFNGSGTFVTMIGCDIENVSANAKAILQTNGASFREVGTIWAGFAGTGTNRVTGSSDTVRSYGGAFELVNTGMAAATPVTIGVTEDGNASYTRRELMPVNTGGGSQEGYERMYRRIAGTEILTHEFQRDYLIEHTKTFAAASATLVLNLTIPASRGIYVECQAEGAQNGDAVHSVFVQAVAKNGSGTVTVTAGTPLTAPAAYAGVFTFVNNGGTLDIKWTPTTVNSSQIFFTFRVRGALTSYTKG